MKIKIRITIYYFTVSPDSNNCVTVPVQLISTVRRWFGGKMVCVCVCVCVCLGGGAMALIHQNQEYKTRNRTVSATKFSSANFKKNVKSKLYHIET